MKFSPLKSAAALVLAFSAGACLFAFPRGAEVSAEADGITPALAPAREDLPRGKMVPSTQTNMQGEEITVDILQAADGTYYLADSERQIYLYDMRNNTDLSFKEAYSSDTGVFEDAYAVSAYENIVGIYDFYADANNLGVSLRGISGENGQVPLQILLHYGYTQANAHYSFEDGAAVIEVGDGSPFGPLYRTALAKDVLTHEYQHAVTDFCAGLVYLNESGAISEAVSDIIGALAEGHEPNEAAFWQTGEDAAPAGMAPMRTAIIPTGGNRMNAKHMQALCGLDHAHENCDNGGVHSNGTILTHMQYNLWRKMPQFFTRERIGKLWYSTLCKLSPNATFAEFAACFREAAETLGFGADALAAIDDTLYSSGLTAGSETHLVTFFNSVPGMESVGYPIEEVCVRHGGTAALPAPPEDVYAERYIYTFISWRGDYTNVTDDRYIFTNYSERDRYYTVRFLDETGNLLKEEQLLFGEDATPPEAPTKEGNERYFYPFLGWDVSYENISEDLTVRALYGQEIRLYGATFRSGDKIYATSQVPYGETLPLPDLSEKTRDAAEVFAGWYRDKNCTVPAGEIEMTENVTLYAKWLPREPSDGGNKTALWVVLSVVGAAAVAVAVALPLKKRKGKKK